MGAAQGVPPTSLLEGGVIPYHPRLGAAVGVWGALILQQVHYWSVTNGRTKDGRCWMVNSIPQWMKYFPGLTERTARRTLGDLRYRGLLLARNDLNTKASDTTNWYSVNYEKLAETVGPNWPIGSGQIGLTGAAKLAHHKNKSTDKKTIEETGSAFALHEATGDQMNVNDVLSKKPGSFVPPANLNATNLAMYWRKLLASEHDVQFMRPPTAREKGQFAHLIKGLGPTMAVAVLTASVKQWGAVVAYLKDYAGVPSLAVQPNVAQILKYCDHIAHFIHKGPVPKIVPPSMVKAEPFVLPTKEKEAVVSIDEFEKHLKAHG